MIPIYNIIYSLIYKKILNYLHFNVKYILRYVLVDRHAYQYYSMYVFNREKIY